MPLLTQLVGHISISQQDIFFLLEELQGSLLKEKKMMQTE